MTHRWTCSASLATDDLLVAADPGEQPAQKQCSLNGATTIDASQPSSFHSSLLRVKPSEEKKHHLSPQPCSKSIGYVFEVANSRVKR